MKNVRSGRDALIWVKRSISSFETDPPTSEFQRGFIASLYEMKKFLTN